MLRRAPAVHRERVYGQDTKAEFRAASAASLKPNRTGCSPRVEIAADLERVRVRCDGQLVADHARVWARHQTISHPAHVAAATVLRRDRIGLVRLATQPEVQIRCLADYDAALGLDELLDSGTGGVDGGVA